MICPLSSPFFYNIKFLSPNPRYIFNTLIFFSYLYPFYLRNLRGGFSLDGNIKADVPAIIIIFDFPEITALAVYAFSALKIGFFVRKIPVLAAFQNTVLPAVKFGVISQRLKESSNRCFSSFYTRS